MRFVPGIMFLFFAAILNAAQAQPEADTPPSNIPDLERRIKEILDKTRTPGAAVAIVSRDRVIWAAGIGAADLTDGRPTTPDTLFRIGSVTKGFVALSVMMLVEGGKLSLDDPIGKLAPEVAFANPWEATDPVRVVHLLEHTTGWDTESFPEMAYDNPVPMALRDALAFRPATRTSRWKPGTGFAYSHVGAPAAAHSVEKLTGRLFEEYVSEHIFRPLGMKSATFFQPADPESRLASGYDPHIRRVNYRNLLLRPAGAINASARDMAAYVRMYLNRGGHEGGRILKPESIDRIETPTSSLAARHGIKSGYGLYNHTRDYKGFTFHGHTGGIAGFGTEMFYLADEGLGYAFMINNFSGAPFYQIGQVLRAYLTRDLPKPVLPAAPALADGQLSSWAGYYEPQNPPIEYFRLTTRLMGIMQVRADGGQLLVQPMLGGTGRKLVTLGGGRFRTQEGSLPDSLFTCDEGGARLMVINQGSIFRELPPWQAWLRLALGAACPTVMMSPILFALWWLTRRLLGKGPRPMNLAVRLWPLAAALCLAGIIAMNSVTGETAWRLGRLTIYSAGLCALTLLLPVSSILSLVAAIRATRQGTRRGLWVYSLICSLAACVVSAYLAFNGLLGLKTWQ